ncbi:hypothetical protein M440DRAFT_1395561 [Trichoderma longibrachiatum ATCC 18648]|uniref:Alcohol dehydrogenase-like C-terminal domain-containing protein n=1 Tax=Trichoderma longibrachiatum ATCC 18648 TaxID=983965 RepID=A0A2T4BQP9_TRILO|nr:hypothetical protein M440DRAFT_1395561 [Trichoderma longibrachiatum ATCC 18648]
MGSIDIPSEQWAQVVEKTGGPVVYKRIPVQKPGPDEVLVNINAPVFDTVIRMITIKGSYVGNRADTQEALDFFRRGLITVPFKTIGLSQLQDIYTLMHEAKIAGRYVVDPTR